MRAWQRLTSPFQAFGWAAGCLYLLDRLLRSCSDGLGLHVYDLTVQPIGDKPLLPARRAREVSFRQLDAASSEFAAMAARDDVKASRLAQGAVCLGAYFKGQWVGYVWFCRERYLEDEVRCTFLASPSKSTVFDFDLVVLPAYRMGIGFAAVWQAASAFLAEQGVTHSFSRITRFNMASRSAHARLGARTLGKALFLKAWGAELMGATLAPYFAISLGRQRVSLKLAVPPTWALSALAGASK